MTASEFNGSWAASFLSKILPSIFMLLLSLVATYVATKVDATSTLINQIALEQAKSSAAIIAIAEDVMDAEGKILVLQTELRERTRARFDTGDAERMEGRISQQIGDHEMRLRALEKIINGFEKKS